MYSHYFIPCRRGPHKNSRRGNPRLGNSRLALTLLELLLVTSILGGLMVAHMQALVHVRTLQALSYEREQMVRRGYNLAEELRAGQLLVPPHGKERHWSEEAGEFVLINEGISPATGLDAIQIIARRDTPQGPIELDLMVFIKSGSIPE